MKIAVYSPPKTAMSYKIITTKVSAYLSEAGCDLLPFPAADDIPAEAQLVWDPAAGGGYVPNIRPEHTDKPIVATVHGARLFALKISELQSSLFSLPKILKDRLLQKRYWEKISREYAAYVAVSDYSANEIHKHLSLPAEKILRIYNALDHAVFHPGHQSPKYFLHISEYQPVKNLDRIIEAYIQATQKHNIPDLHILSRSYPDKNLHPKIHFLDDRYRTDNEMANLYRQALAFIFPSLHEGFGMPIIEAMACGCPVITSDITACPEVAEDAALLVDPKSTEQISQAIIKLATDQGLRGELRQKGLKRAADFTWEKTGEDYYTLFKRIVHE